MLTILNFLKKNKTIPMSAISRITRVHIRSLPLNKEWVHGIYRFNKNSLRTLPALHSYVFTLLKRYFNITSLWLQEKTLSTKHLKRMRKFSGQKFWISSPEMKHTHDKINITIYIYNKTYDYYKKKLELVNTLWEPTTIKKSYKKFKVYKKKVSKEKNSLQKIKYTLTRRQRILKQKYPFYLGKNKPLYYSNLDYYNEIINWLKLDKFIVMSQYKTDILNLVKLNNKKKLVNAFKILKIQHYNYLLNSFNKELTYLKLKQVLLYNEFKYNELLLTPVTKMLETIYKKKIEYNIVTLKYFHLSSSILSQIISTKIKSPKFRGRSLSVVYRAINGLKVPLLTRNKLEGEAKPFTGTQNVILGNKELTTKDHLDEFLLTENKVSKTWSDRSLEKVALANIENKGVSGVFINIAGRLTRRYRAQRAMKRLRSKGTLKNVYSAHRNWSSTLSRGYSNINVEKTMISSKVRIGAFGVTGWVASY